MKEKKNDTNYGEERNRGNKLKWDISWDNLKYKMAQK